MPGACPCGVTAARGIPELPDMAFFEQVMQKMVCIACFLLFFSYQNNRRTTVAQTCMTAAYRLTRAGHKGRVSERRKQNEKSTDL
jgi:hypothetical protein